MLNLLILGAVIALGVVIYNMWNSDTGTTKQKQEMVDNGQKGCMWLLIFLGGIAIFALARACT